MSNPAQRRALIVIDVQNEYINGNFQIEYPPVASSLPNIAAAMDAATAKGIPVVVVQHVSAPESPIFARGSEGQALHASVAERPRTHLIEKKLPSVFAGTDFADWLKANAIDTLTIVGYMTHNCDDSTTREAMHRGFKVELLLDATGSLPYSNRAGVASAEEIHRVTCVVMQSTFAAVMATDEWVAMLDSGEAAERDNVYMSNRRALATLGNKTSQ
jgi:nicotinamidase-related amidase